MTIRILIINGRTMGEMTAGLQHEGNDAADPAVTIASVTADGGPLMSEDYHDDPLAIPGILKKIIQHDHEFDAFVIAHWGDPGIEAAREITAKPVVGITEASIYLCNMLATKWAVVMAAPPAGDLVQQAIKRTGFRIGPNERSLGVYTSERGMEDAEPGRAADYHRLAAAAQKAIADGAQAIALGYSGMSALAGELEQQLGVAVVDSLRAAVQMAESVVRLGKRTSKVNTYKWPEAKPLKGYDPLFESVQADRPKSAE